MRNTLLWLAAVIVFLSVPPAPLAADAGEDLVRAILGDDDPAAARDPKAVVMVRDIRCLIPEGVDRAWIESVIDVKVGARMTVAELERLLIRSRRKLEATRQLVRVGVYALPAKKDAHERTVVVEADEGPRFGFFCRPWDIGVSISRLFGADKSMSLTLGFDTQEIAYYDPALGYSPFFLLVDVYNIINSSEGLYVTDSLGALVRLGFNATENIAFSLDSGIIRHFFPDSYFLYPGVPVALSTAEREALGIDRPRIFLKGGVGLSLHFFRPYDDNRAGLKGYVNGNCFIDLDNPAASYFSVNADLKLLLLPADWLFIMFRNTAGIHFSRTFAYLRYDVASVYRGVPAVATADIVDVIRAEASLCNLFSLSPFGVRVVDLMPFIFIDIARAWKTPEEFDWNRIGEGVEPCAGGGIYLYLRTFFNMYVTLGGSVSFARGNAFRFFYKFSLELY